MLSTTVLALGQPASDDFGRSSPPALVDDIQILQGLFCAAKDGQRDFDRCIDVQSPSKIQETAAYMIGDLVGGAHVVSCLILRRAY